MRRNRWMLAALCVALMAPAAQAAVRVDTVRLGHGVRAWYSASDTVPIVDVEISFEGGGFAGDPAGREGLATLAAAMLNEGAGPYDALAFNQALEDGAIEMSFNSTADRMTVHVRALREQAVRAGELLALALGQPHFAEDDLARVKAQMQTALKRQQESADYRASRLFASHGFSSHPYANPPYGTAASVARLSADDLRRFMANYVTRSNVYVAAAGDVDGGLLDDMLAPVIDVLGANPTEVYVASVKLRGAGETLRETMPVPQTVVLFAAPGIARNDPKFYAASILNEALGGNGLVARLARAVRQDRGLVYGVGSGLDVRRGTALISGQLATTNAKSEDAIAAVKQVLFDTSDRGLTQQECEDARTHVLGSQVLRLDSSQDIATTLLFMQVHDLGRDYLEKREGYLNGVRCSEVNALAKELLDPSRFLFVTVGGTDAP